VSFDGVGYFRANGGDTSLGTVIPDDLEVIEIILAGYGRYHYSPGATADGVVKGSVKVGPGAIIRHTGGSTTLKDPDRDDPYQCMYFRFKVKKSKWIASPVSQWSDLNECSAFCWEIFSQFHNRACDPEILGIHTYARILWETEKSVKSQAYGSMPLAIQKMVKAVQEKPQDGWTVELLGKAAGVSESHVYLLFRKHLQTSPHNYILTHRLNKAKELLITTSMRVKEICYTCGFGNGAHFNRCFRQHLAMTPVDYRKKYAMP
jgi:AraC-like DNA-binding protein